MRLRLQRLYQRYMTRHLRLTLGVVRSVGAPDVTVSVRDGRVYLDGPGRLEHGGAQAAGAHPSLPYDPTSECRVSLRDGQSPPDVVPALSVWRRAWAHMALWPSLARRLCTVLQLLPTIRDPQARAKAVRRLGLTAEAPAPHLRLHAGALAPHPAEAKLVLVLPVHNALAHVIACLARLPHVTDLPWRLIIVDDGSTDPDIAPFLADWVARHPQATLISHPAPKGFAGAVNAALAHLGSVTCPVVLLNSDVTLPAGWASRLIAPIRADGGIASVTPLSNEGELMGAPHACAGVALRNGEVDAVDAALAPLARDRGLPSLPTGTGFCMALSPHWLAEVPRFDDSFGRGYGEEVDWCQRTRALGGRHVCQPGLFVGHVGAASFGRQQRAALRAKAAPILSQRWPRFDTEVQHVLQEDPLAGDRLRAGMAWAKARLNGHALPVYLAHSMGGGTARWLQQRLQGHEVAMVLRVGGVLRWQVELHTQAGVTRGATDLFDDVQSLMALAGPREVIYTCAVGDPKPEEIPFRLLDLCAGGQRLEVLFHDYFPLNRDYTFRSEPDPEWQALWRVALHRADGLTVFSQASAKIVADVHPDLAAKIRHVPHAPLAPVPRLTPVARTRPVVGVMGNLNAHKGASVVADLARVFADTNEARLVVLGEVAPDCPLPRQVTVIGGYELADLPHLVARHQIGVWLIPALWPETFSYVTQEALATGLPTIGFDLGGQGDALRASQVGHPVALRNDGSADLALCLAAFRALPDWPRSRGKTVSKPLPNMFRPRIGV